MSGDDGISRVGDDRGEGVPQFRAQLRQPGLVAGDADDNGARFRQSGGDAAAEAPAGTGDQCGHS